MYANGYGPVPVAGATGPTGPTGRIGRTGPAEAAHRAIAVRRRAGRSVLAFRGSLDRTTAPALRSALLSEVARRPSVLVVDLSQLEYWDSCGMGAVVAAFKSGRGQGVTLAVAGLRGRAATSYRTTNLARLIPTYPDVASALARGRAAA